MTVASCASQSSLSTFLILGNHPVLARAEMERAVEALGGIWKSEAAAGSFLLGTLSGIDRKTLLARLGGTMKVGQIFHTELFSGRSRLETIKEVLKPDRVIPWLKSSASRVEFGISLYASADSIPFRLARQLTPIGLTIREALHAQGKRARWVTSREGSSLSSVVVTKNRLLERGGEVCVLFDEKRIWVGMTEAVQDFEAYAVRDYDRPRRDPKSGMLPPKVAQILINLSGLSTDRLLFDPFCGSGTILMEAARMGFRHLAGSDISEAAVDDTRENLDWFLRTSHLPKPTLKLLVSDIRKLVMLFPAHSVDGIVTEPYLGPPLRGRERPAQLQRNFAVIQKLYDDSARVASQLLHPGGVFVMVLPKVVTPSTTFVVSLNAWQSVKLQPILLSGMSARQTFEYGRKDQLVHREIGVWRRMTS
jgi:tRNA (guanine10-N2)-dimethyltransferase